MKIPETVKVGAYTYEVKSVSHPVVVDGKDCYGSIDYRHQVISIRDTSLHSEQSAMRTFWHEMVHAFVHERGLDWGDNNELYTEELARAIHAFCVDNGFGFVGRTGGVT